MMSNDREIPIREIRLANRDGTKVLKGKVTDLQNYIDAKSMGITWRLALTWEQVVWEAQRAIGVPDAELWLADMRDILVDPFFVRNLRPSAISRLRKDPHYAQRTLVSAHQEAYKKLGYYNVWRPNCEPVEVRGESEVRTALLENRIVQAML